MLVLARRQGESLIIGDGITAVKLVKIISNQDKLGIEAPEDVTM